MASATTAPWQRPQNSHWNATCRWQSSPAAAEPQHVSVFPNNEAAATAYVVPKYLNDGYWWAYVNPMAIRALDRQYLVNMVLWGHATLLQDTVFDGIGDANGSIHGRTLQIACVYGNFTEKLMRRMTPDASLNVIDAVPGQVENLKRKVDSKLENVSLSCAAAEDLEFEDDSFDQAVIFFLLHEIPNSARIQALKEAARVLKPGGKLVLVDFHRPKSMWHKIWMTANFIAYEPYAKDLWYHEIVDWLPENMSAHKELLCDGVYQKVVATKH